MDALLLTLLFNLILFVFVLIGYTKISMLLYFAIIGSLLIVVPTMIAFGDYIYFGMLLCLTNVSVSVVGLSKSRPG